VSRAGALTTYTHDVFDRCTSAISPSGTTAYGRDPLGRLTSVTTAQSTSVHSHGATGTLTVPGVRAILKTVENGLKRGAHAAHRQNHRVLCSSRAR